MVHSLIKNRQLIWQMTKRDVIGRYKGSTLGLTWSFFNPLIMLAVYTFVFSIAFKARWQTGSDSKSEFALALFIGMIVHGLLAESVNRAPSLILNNVNYVKKVVFPLEILPWVAMGATLFHTLVSLFVWGLFFIAVNQTFQWTALFLPFIFAPLIFFTLGLTWFLAALGVYLRDVGQVTSVFTTVLLFMSPVFYPISNIPERFQPYLYANPLTFIIEQSRAVLMWGQVPNWEGLLLSLIISLFVAWLGFSSFQKTRRGFADVL
ncbi:ABC transporter permease [Gimesia aquarii]|uniref:Transport permease protein n=1 Tax=Gimesia aquarii TaxID=2527964 RepID=A0A517X0D3_9PLAN|nr:Teichoic acid translocation permease protein TagG [Gimesia aquarii]